LFTPSTSSKFFNFNKKPKKKSSFTCLSLSKQQLLFIPLKYFNLRKTKKKMASAMQGITYEDRLNLPLGSYLCFFLIIELLFLCSVLFECPEVEKVAHLSNSLRTELTLNLLLRPSSSPRQNTTSKEDSSLLI